MSEPLFSVLDDPFGSALRGRHRGFARAHGTAIAYQPDVSVFFAHPAVLTDEAYADLAALAGPGGTVGLRDRTTPLPDGWPLLATYELVLYTGEDVAPAADPELVELTPDDVPEMTALIELTRPGPFAPRTIELGAYLGYRDPDTGRLLAMAGERAKPDGWTEISAVCTHPEARGRRLARRLIGAVVAGVRERGDLPFLHTTVDNPACALYERMGFVRRDVMPLEIVQIPGR
ncbi:MAG: GNAT family N-acetyltransferase [Gordonia sp. (in: high G+C Gram-positive bacteria)]|uniref:GNAT family N-acetyltransferase n=1 Tax=Gordonia sp. (in: high G+C Gram-positive bacteria) TaxID=84139 RepID=UPI0039E68DDA